LTIAISVKVHDGLVLAADSASTIMAGQGGVQGVYNVYNNANKVFNLYKGLPIGGITWGAGSIGHASISTLVKDLRKRFMGNDPNWKFDPNPYTMEEVAKRTREFLFEELYEPLYQAVPDNEKPELGFLVAGYSSGQDLAEEWLIQISRAGCPAPSLVRPQQECGVIWFGQPEAINRLLLGWGTALPSVLQDLGVPDDQIGPAMAQITTALSTPLVIPPMPIQDTIDLAEFLVHLTIMYSRFSPGAPTVGGPIESAAITKHEGFKWVKRKHYYDRRFNPPSP
jgi:hypothetical protein